MSEVMITVRGEHQVRVAPERAIVSLSASVEGPDRADVIDRTLSRAGQLREGIQALQASGAVETWSSRRLAVRSERPWSGDGTRLALVHHASVEFTATFIDFGDLSTWVGEISAGDDVTVNGTDWILTPQTRARVEQEVAAEAVRTAVTRASAYASALGLGSVEPIELADAGLITDRGSADAAPKAMRAFAAAPAPSGLVLNGDDITVSATVEARFVAGGATNPPPQADGGLRPAAGARRRARSRRPGAARARCRGPGADPHRSPEAPRRPCRPPRASESASCSARGWASG
jgi:uncharacterized protein YggE